jgi:hypothetical protein
MNQTGIFYDDKLNRRVMTQIAKKRKQRPIDGCVSLQDGVFQSSKPKNLFSDFEFNIEFEVIR